MSELGPKTKANLEAAFAGESQARNKYTYFAKVARKEGYLYIAKIFEETADNESQHAKDEFKLLEQCRRLGMTFFFRLFGKCRIHRLCFITFPVHGLLKVCGRVTDTIKQIAKVEKEHQERYKKLLEMVKNGTVYKRDTAIRWRCSKCGYVHEGTEPPTQCPSCRHPKGYFEPADMDIK
jgi:rubrerythrin